MFSSVTSPRPHGRGYNSVCDSRNKNPLFVAAVVRRWMFSNVIPHALTGGATIQCDASTPIAALRSENLTGTCVGNRDIPATRASPPENSLHQISHHTSCQSPPRLRKFSSPSNGWVAQLAEQRTENPRVGGSIPSPATISKNSQESL